MLKLERDAPIALSILGMGTATVGADLVSSPDLALTLAAGGSLVAWGSVFGMAFLDDELWGRRLGDERMNRLTYRAGTASWLLMLGVVSTAVLSLAHYEGSVAAEDALLGVLAVGLAAFVGALAYNGRRM